MHRQVRQQVQGWKSFGAQVADIAYVQLQEIVITRHANAIL